MTDRWCRASIRGTARLLRRALRVAAVTACAGCAHHVASMLDAPHCVADVLYFGRNIAGAGRPDSAVLSQDQWRQFADDAFRRWIPGGSTETDAAGRYTLDNAWVAESTKIVTVVHVVTPAANAGVDSVIALYQRRFKQESVGRVQSDVRSTLCGA
jgi:Protein of unknown function (DUF3574)